MLPFNIRSQSAVRNSIHFLPVSNGSYWNSERDAYFKRLPNTLTEALRTMLIYTSSDQGRAAVPPISNNNLSPFPMKITVKVGGAEVG